MIVERQLEKAVAEQQRGDGAEIGLDVLALPEKIVLHPVSVQLDRQNKEKGPHDENDGSIAKEAVQGSRGATHCWGD